MDRHLSAGLSTGAVDPQQILARADRREGSDLDNLGSAASGALFRCEREQPDLACDLRCKRGQACGALGLCQC
jgi:hypothetical protein